VLLLLMLTLMLMVLQRAGIARGTHMHMWLLPLLQLLNLRLHVRLAVARLLAHGARAVMRGRQALLLRRRWLRRLLSAIPAATAAAGPARRARREDGDRMVE